MTIEYNALCMLLYKCLVCYYFVDDFFISMFMRDDGSVILAFCVVFTQLGFQGDSCYIKNRKGFTTFYFSESF